MMSSDKTDVEATWLRSKIVSDILSKKKFVANFKAENAETFKINDIQIKIIGIEEAFMLTCCYRATISFEYGGKAGKRTIVVKKTPEIPEEVFEAINFGTLFSNEIYTYTKILPAIEKFTEQPFIAPKFYYADLQKGFATIILEDFSEHNWCVAKEKVNLSLEHVLLAAKYLGNFHGIGFAMRQAKRAEFDEITSVLKESRFANDCHPDWEMVMRQSIKRLAKVTREYHADVKEEFVEKLAKLLDDSYSYGRQRVLPREPMITLCHGDYLRNNVAYKYKENSTTPTDIMMFDMQTMRICSPMIDLSIFLALSAYAEVRHSNFTLIFDTYCETLAATYEQYAKEKLPACLQREAMLKEYISYLPYSISITACFLMNLVEPEEISSQDLLMQQRSPEEITKECMTRGGAVVDRELAHQAWELFKLSEQYNIDICEGFKM